MSQHRSRRAILILEAPWELDPDDANRTSVLPFIQGIAKLTNDTEVHYANFYEEDSFEIALNHLCKGEFDSRIVYVAAHGYMSEVQEVDIYSVLSLIAEKSKKYKITGVMLGTCFIGEYAMSMEMCLQESDLRWCAGYTSATGWLEATLVDCAILARMSRLNDEVFHDRDDVVDQLAESMRLFSPDYDIGVDYNDEPVRLADSMSFVVQPKGRGNRAKQVTQEVWMALEQ